MRRIGRSDGAAYAELVRRHLDRGLALAQRVTGSRVEAEDIMQEAFLRVWATATRWQPGRARFSTWLFRVVLNLCIDGKRRKKPAPLPENFEAIDDTPGAEQRVIDNQRAGIVLLALQALPPRQRAAIALCYYQGLSNLEAAAALSVTVKALESLLIRGRRKLRRSLGSLQEELLHTGNPGDRS